MTSISLFVCLGWVCERDTLSVSIPPCVRIVHLFIWYIHRTHHYLWDSSPDRSLLLSVVFHLRTFRSNYSTSTRFRNSWPPILNVFINSLFTRSVFLTVYVSETLLSHWPKEFVSFFRLHLFRLTCSRPFCHEGTGPLSLNRCIGRNLLPYIRPYCFHLRILQKLTNPNGRTQIHVFFVYRVHRTIGFFLLSVQLVWTWVWCWTTVQVD